MRRGMAALAAAGLLFTLAACSEPEPVVRSEAMPVTDETGQPDYYSVRASAVVTDDEVSARVRLGFDVVIANQTKFSPVATIHFQDGTTATCGTDLRQRPSLTWQLDDWTLECEPRDLPEDWDGAYIVVVDDYA